MKVQLHSFTALDEGGWLTPRPCALPPGKRRVPIVTGSWVGITADMAGAENLPPSPRTEMSMGHWLRQTHVHLCKP